MFTHAREACDSNSGTWLPLIDYSVKTGVSLSTLRRKIKNKGIQFRLTRGKYWILYSEANNLAANEQPNPASQDPSGWEFSTFAAAFQAPVQTQKPQAKTEMLSDAYEWAIAQRDVRIQALEKRNSELEAQLQEMTLLVQMLESKYQVRY